MKGISRRDFMQQSATLAGGALLPFPRGLFTKKKEDPLVGIQIGAISFIDEGINQVLDNVQERGQVNTLFLAAFTYDTGIGGGQIKGFRFPDHGKQEYRDFHGGNFATPHPEFYKNTILKQTKAPDHGNWDMLEKVIPEAKKRGLKVYVFNQDSFTWHKDTPNIAKLQETGIYGQHVESCCDYNPEYQHFVNAMTRDISASYDIDGVMWSSERQGPFNNAIQPVKGDQPTARITCFCPHHRKVAKERGIDAERALEGFRKLVVFSKQATKGMRPTDGYFSTFWRILTDYPEILAWEKLWTDGNRGTYKNVYDAVKAVKPKVQAGFHIWHPNSLSPFTRAQTPFEELAYADFIKPVVYDIVGGPRYAAYIDAATSTVFRDVPKEEFLQYNNHLMNYGPMKLDDLPKNGMPLEYLSLETKRALDSVQGKCKIYTGIDIDIPTKPENKQTSPEAVYNSTITALKTGAQGIIFSRKYSEMMLDNISGGGKAIRDFRS